MNNGFPIPSSAGRRSSDQVARLRRLATLLDSAVEIPVIGSRVGLDALLGLLPGIGDLVGGVMSLFIVVSAARLGAPPSMIARMLLNVAIDTAVGTVPVLGDVFDAGWKSNLKNVALIEDHVADPAHVKRRSRLLMLGIAAVGALALVGAIAGAVALFHLLGSSAG